MEVTVPSLALEFSAGFLIHFVLSFDLVAVVCEIWSHLPSSPHYFCVYTTYLPHSCWMKLYSLSLKKKTQQVFSVTFEVAFFQK